MTHVEYAWKVAEIASFVTAHLEQALEIAVTTDIANGSVESFVIGMRHRLDDLVKAVTPCP